VTKTLTINIWLAHSPHESKAHVITLRRTIIQVSSSPLLSMAGLLRYYAGSRTVFWPISQRPLGHKRLEMVPEPRGVCFKIWVIKSRSCLRHSPRSHIGDVLWNSEPDSLRQFSSAFLVFRKMRSWTLDQKWWCWVTWWWERLLYPKACRNTVRTHTHKQIRCRRTRQSFSAGLRRRVLPQPGSDRHSQLA
jgi:hypothetical protein